jgi:hypothetical protein
VDLSVDWWAKRLRGVEESTAMILLRPDRDILAALVVLIVSVVWFSNIGFNVRALLTDLGVGFIAAALAAQHTLKKFFDSMMIRLDKPYGIGQRIVVNGQSRHRKHRPPTPHSPIHQHRRHNMSISYGFTFFCLPNIPLSRPSMLPENCAGRRRSFC